MKIREISITKFKRFTNLTVKDIPESAKLIVLVGPNGSGKTSFFEAINHWYKVSGFSPVFHRLINKESKSYFEKTDGDSLGNNWYNGRVKINFHNNPTITQENVKGKFYFRTAYRNEAEFKIDNIKKQNIPTQQIRLHTLMVNDLTVSENYQRLIANTLIEVYKSSNDTKSVEELRNELIGKIQNSVSAIFEDLIFTSIGDPLTDGGFYFDKGSSKDFNYKNLSAGEKSVFDLILDLIIKSSYYENAIYCIDEPESHLHTRLQGKVLKELYKLIPETSQLWISSHSIGMLKQAEELEIENPGSVVFLDFDNRDFDLTEIMRPAKIDKAIWDKFFDLAFADFSKLISPATIVFCEGTSQGRKYKDFDAQVYGRIFENKYHDTKFISIGGSTEIEDLENQSMKMLSNILKSSKLIKFIDRDDKSAAEVEELLEKGIKTSSRRHIESYLFDDELIAKLCDSVGKPDLLQSCLDSKDQAVKESIERGNPADDIKSASGKIFTEIKKVLNLTQCGNNKCAFIRDTMTPLITEETNVFRELEKEIFD